MGKKIVVLTGSPRKRGNSSAMADSFVRAAREKGHQVTRFDTAFLKVGGCRACQTCYRTGKACSFDDDFNELAPAIVEADAVVFATPVYWYTFPAQLKAVIDKFYSLYCGKTAVGGKSCALLACAEEDELSVFEGLLFAYKNTTELMQWRTVGEVLVPGVDGAGEIRNTDGEQRAAALAEKI